jgi:hypothetical protein
MHSSLAMPHYGIYVEAAFVAWIIVQAITGKAAYKRSRWRKQDNPRAFWSVLGVEALIIVPVICFQFGWDTVGIVLAAILEVSALGFLLWCLAWCIFLVATRWKELWRKAAEDPKRAFYFLFFGRK